MQTRVVSVAACIVMAMVASGCARKPVPPMLSFNADNCAATPDLGSARPVTLKDAASAVFNGATPCLQPSGGVARLYAVFQLPESSEPLAVTVKSVPRGQGVVAPYVVLLDEKGTPTREMPHDRFMFRGGSLQLGIRPQANERYLIVASNPDSVGQKTSGIVADAQTATVATGTGGFFVMSSGFETTREMTRAHGGTIVVSAELLPNSPDSSSNHQSMAPLR